MKEFNSPSNIGVGLFSTEPTEIRINFPNGTYADFKVHAMTQEVLVALEKDRVKFDGYKNQTEALEHSAKILEAIVVSGEYDGVTVLGELKKRILSNIGLTKTLLEAARSLAEETIEEEEKLRELVRWALDPEGKAYWQTVERMAKRHGLEQAEYEVPRPLPSNTLAWRAWALCFPDCRTMTINGLGFWDWQQVKVVLEAWGLDLTSDIQRKLRVCIFEAMPIEQKTRKEKGGKNGK